MRTAHRVATLTLAIAFLVLLCVLWDQKQRIGNDFNVAFGVIADHRGLISHVESDVSHTERRLDILEGRQVVHMTEEQFRGYWISCDDDPAIHGFFVNGYQLGALNACTCTWTRYDEFSGKWGKRERLQAHPKEPDFMPYER